MDITLTVSDALAEKLIPLQNRLPEIIERGLRDCQNSSINEFSGCSNVVELLATLPTPEQVLELRPALALQERMRALLEEKSLERTFCRRTTRMGAV